MPRWSHISLSPLPSPFTQSTPLPGFYLGRGFGGKMVREKYALGRGLGPLPRKMLSLSKHIYSSVFTCLLAGKSFLYANIINSNRRNILGRSQSVCGRSFPTPTSPSRLNPALFSSLSCHYHKTSSFSVQFLQTGAGPTGWPLCAGQLGISS